MHAVHVPRPDLRFWITITIASMLGANFGDFCSHDLGLGHWRGLPILAGVFAVILVAERLASWRTELFYWFAVLTLRTAATNLADLATHDLKLADALVLPAFGVPLLAIAVAQGTGRWLADGSKPRVDGLYWLAMLFASTFGTALGDASADLVSLPLSTALWALPWAVGVALVSRAAALPALGYWAMVAVVRTFGTNAGDLLVSRHGLGLGLPLSTTVTALAFAAVYAAWRPARTAVAAAE